VGLVDDHPIIRAGLHRILETAGDFEVVLEAADGRSAVEQVLRVKPEVVLMDVWLPGLSGIDATRRILQGLPACRIVILSQQERSESVEAALREGAVGYVLKGSTAEEILSAVRAARAGKCFLSPAIASHVVRAFAHPETRAMGAPRLSTREREVLQLVARGYSSKEAAVELGLSPRTAETHRTSLMNKLGIHKVADLVRYAVREGVIAP
jgi:DNA-binding NarL/FixJ family response regulator